MLGGCADAIRGTTLKIEEIANKLRRIMTPGLTGGSFRGCIARILLKRSVRGQYPPGGGVAEAFALEGDVG
jgi:hypothetical protein